MGTAMLLAFIGLLIAILIENKSGPLSFWTVVTAGEIAAWRVKWEVLFASIITLGSGAHIIRTVSRDPSRFIGLLPARIGFGGALAVVVLVAALIGITVPARISQRQDSIEAAIYARGYTLHRALLEYRDLHGTLPSDPDKYVEALRTLPDPDGSIAEALRFVDPGGYSAGSKIAAAALTKSKPLVTRGGALRSASTPTNLEPAGVSFTSYELRLPSEHRLFASDDDFVMQDGVIKKASEVTSTSSRSTRNP
jgi:type II secretory pathway pseudopilin PulG